jgi:hypothetical protein
MVQLGLLYKELLNPSTFLQLYQEHLVQATESLTNRLGYYVAQRPYSINVSCHTYSYLYHCSSLPHSTFAPLQSVFYPEACVIFKKY